MSISKKILKSKPVCKVTFKIEKNEAGEAETAYLVGDFNKWDRSAPMKKQKDGSFSTTLDLETNKNYQFKYLLNETTWIHDEQADKVVPSEFPDSFNSVIEL